MRRFGKRTDNQFNSFNYSLFAATWSQLGRELMTDYNITMTDLRLLTAIDALVQLYSYTLNGEGITGNAIQLITGFDRRKINVRLIRLAEQAYIIEDIEQYGAKRTVRRYKLSKKGKEIINKLSGNIDKVHERIIAYLYSKKLLK